MAADEGTSRRKVQELIEIEGAMQKLWESEKLFEQDAPAEGQEPKETYVVTFPYPYVNGRFHLGHAFTVSKAEFAASFQRLKGKQSLFPFGMHCTGMPIKTAADKVKRELEEFGFPPDFPIEDQFMGYDFNRDPRWLEELKELLEADKKQSGKKKKKGANVKEAAKEAAELLTARKRAYFKKNVNDALPLTITESAEEAEKRKLAELAKKAEQAADPTKSFHSNRSKLQQKGGNMRQWYILKQLDIPEEEIPRFAEASYWLEYFPPLYRQDLTRFGLKVDWRRTFITTDANPYYDSFVRWQFDTLHEMGNLRFAKRYGIFSPKDDQPCMDHDRSKGEGVLPKEYTLIKMRVPQEELQARFPALAGRNVFLAPATLRPETMYGQTNCWVNPDGEYGAFEVTEAGAGEDGTSPDVFILTERAALNLAFQGYSPEPRRTSCLLEISGRELLGLRVHAPLATAYPLVHVLPMSTVKDEMGTGVVTSVPSDSPDDYVNLVDLQKSAEWREKCHVRDEWVVPFAPVPIIRVPAIGKEKQPSDLCAVLLCTELKINGPKQRVLLDEAKKEAYNVGFHDGVMMVGEFAGKPVAEAKPLLRQHLLDTNQAIRYSEPEGEVISRSGDTCVVALTDQWYIHYGKEEWKAKTAVALERLETYNPRTRARFQATMDWLEEWACSRTYGLGTYLPWDKAYLIDSLSDSTIYMAYYTVAQFLQRGQLDPKKLTAEAIAADPGVLVRPEQMTHGVWEHLFRGGPVPDDCTIDPALLATMRREFLHWYPVSLRVSGNDLINNHLTFFLANHTAIFPEEHWPKAVRTNGFLLLDGNKMSKSTGNFMTLANAIEKFGVDATRFALAEGGDSVDDSNFTEENANSAILHLHSQLAWVKEALAAPMRSGEYSFADKWFKNEVSHFVKEAEQEYEKTNFREALHHAFANLQGARDRYVLMTASKGAHEELIRWFIECQVVVLSPICPHFADHVWRTVLERSGSVVDASWPEVQEVDRLIQRQGQYLFDKLHDIAKQLQYQSSKVLKAAPTSGVVYVASCYPPDRVVVLTKLKELFDASGEFPNPKDSSAAIAGSGQFDKKKTKVLMKFVMETEQFFKLTGPSALDLTSPIDEVDVLKSNMEYIKEALAISFDLDVVLCDEDQKPPEGTPELRKDPSVTMPGRPSIVFQK